MISMSETVVEPKKVLMVSPNGVKVVATPITSMIKPGMSTAMLKAVDGISSPRTCLRTSSVTRDGKAVAMTRMSTGVTRRTKGSIVVNHQIVRPRMKILKACDEKATYFGSLRYMILKTNT